MKKYLSIILITVSVVIILLPKRVLKACTDFLDPDQFHISFFNPSIQVAKDNYALYLSYHALNGISSDWIENKYTSKYIPTAEDTNIGEWAAYFGFKAKKEDINVVVYKLKYTALSSIINSGRVPDSLKDNSCLSILMKNKTYANVVSYLLFAKRCEPLVTYLPPWWEEKPKPKDTMKMIALLAEGLPLYKKETSDVIKMRYAYQLVRLAGYANENGRCVKLYDQCISPLKIPSTIRNWALLIRGVALINNGNKAEGNYDLSLVFDRCKEKKIVAFQYFDASAGASADLMEAALHLCKNDHEIAVVMAMKATGVYAAYPIGLTDVYKFDPNLPDLENLIVREINKQEQIVLKAQLFTSSKYSYINGSGIGSFDYDESTKKTKENRLGDLSAIMDKILDEGKMKNRALPYLAKAYIALLQSNTDLCKKTLDDAAQYCKGNSKMEDQLHFLNLLCRINSEKKLKSSVEDAIYPELVWLSGKDHPVVNYEYYANVMRVLAMKYMAQDDFAKAVVCISKSAKVDASESIASFGETYEMLNRSGTHDNIKAVLELLQKKKKSDYEKFITDSFKFDNDRLLDFQGTLYLKEHNFEKAADAFSQITPEYWKEEKFKTYLAANPFSTLITDTHAKTYLDTVAYNKYTFSKKMVELQKKKDAQAMYAYATGLYNMSYFGNSWLMDVDAWSSGDYYSYSDTAMKKYGAYPVNTAFSDEYFGCAKVKNAYLAAMNASKDPEFKAQCCYMAAKCQQKELGLFDTSDTTLRKCSLFETIRTQYNTTHYYDTIKRECSLFSEFVAYKAK
ncbi:MAG TPA: hypothetical protein VNZ45_03865 [Bacteroidia bacterium]|jgi:hypothetical protein|nr:hypothetical protein [Bacteroidia bacterium]